LQNFSISKSNDSQYAKLGERESQIECVFIKVKALIFATFIFVTTTASHELFKFQNRKKKLFIYLIHSLFGENENCHSLSEDVLNLMKSMLFAINE
jgi:hypothetical protein